MAHAASPSLVRRLGDLFDGGSAARASPTANCSSGSSPAATTPARRPSPRPRRPTRTDGAGRLPASSSAIAITPRMHSRPSSWSWPARPDRSASPELLGNWLYGVASAPPERPVAGSLADAGPKRMGPSMMRRNLMTHRPIRRCSSASKPRPSIARSTAYRMPSARRSCSATSSVSRLTRRQIGCDGLSARSAAGSPAGGRSSAAACRTQHRVLRLRTDRGGKSVRSASASVSPLLCDTTTQAATAFAARHAASGVLSASATILAQEVLRTMLLHKLRLTAASPCLSWQPSPLASASSQALWPLEMNP